MLITEKTGGPIIDVCTEAQPDEVTVLFNGLHILRHFA